jgi:hypothetical protein
LIFRAGGSGDYAVTLDNVFVRDVTPGVAEISGVSNEFTIGGTYLTFNDPGESAFGVPDSSPSTDFSPQPIVVVKDAGGNTSTAYSDREVKLEIYEQSGSGATLSGTTLAKVDNDSTVDGVADFTGNGLDIDKAGTYRLKATLNLVENGTFSVDEDWTKGAGWSIGSGVGTAASADTDLEQDIGAIATSLTYGLMEE